MISFARCAGVVFFACLVACSTGDRKPDVSATIDVAAVEAAIADLSNPEEEMRADGGIVPAVLDLPAWPWWENKGLAVDEKLLAEQAGDWCSTVDGEGSAPSFFFGAMPLETVGALCVADGPPPEVLVGHMYLSGWYGGLWFRDNAELGMGAPGEGGDGHPLAPVLEEEFMEVANNAAALIALSAVGSAKDVAARNLEGLMGPSGGGIMEMMMDSLLTLYGYNHGYVKAILENPPEGVSAAGMSVPCPEYLECVLADGALAPYAPFEAALARLADPPDESWEFLATEVEKSLGWVAVGEGFWSEGSIAPEAWVVLVEINRVYLRVTAAAALGSMLGHGDNDEDAGRCALLLEAATDTWNRAYFLALGADAPKGTLPGLECLGRN
jgi:hypothetical protein